MTPEDEKFLSRPRWKVSLRVDPVDEVSTAKLYTFIPGPNTTPVDELCDALLRVYDRNPAACETDFKEQVEALRHWGKQRVDAEEADRGART